MAASMITRIIVPPSQKTVNTGACIATVMKIV